MSRTSKETVKRILTQASKDLWRQLSQEREGKHKAHPTFSSYQIKQLVLETANFYTVYELACLPLSDFIAMCQVSSFQTFLASKVGIETGESLGLAHQKTRAWGQSLLMTIMARECHEHNQLQQADKTRLEE
ncbi:hypothetical protein FPOAC2_03647 [Fusarium poae]|uniref:hypothetical protein n=1 Tax=Fusarium poae TaxID=36050 RepID=UPI001CE96582|nr:hypothetical protein FPOAC1_003460 [Fusarium poae]KAG8677442.1 hypothetical protein FPOAC1_003460 [Fusarium poae]